MNTSFYEKLVLVILSLLLLFGAVILHVKKSRPFKEITVEKGAFDAELTLEEAERKLAEARKVNINTAGIREIVTIPGIGEGIASRIVEYRDTYGRFCDEKDLLDVKGIGEKKLERMREYIKY